MEKLKYFQTAAALSCALLFPLVTFAQRSGDIPYSEATFQVSSDPTKVVLQVITSGSALGIVSTITVYGDGLVEFEKKQRGHVLDKYTATAEIGIDGVQELMGVAVSRGLPEWDSSTILAWMRQENPSTLKVVDGARFRVSLTLEEYQRGEYKKSDHAVTFTANAPNRHAEFYPEIQQFQGVVELHQLLTDKWQEARGQQA